ncbi:peptidase inhibitor family I36 protein [Micromonospora sp. WMMD1082]|uniref:peptidase inhibitor family I36 protein n=1 Tax=Micromonospora sp. WMMD1082 TaxID=3016104 RepID=UPI002415DD7A|nr:peptidase inhibitor family I36 protein [Micromonospora sp. WMMD1082]MDG4795709.1 peptidase inhibitor family I36 protein [Micromonospora sp. WMMD1082]
MKRPFRAGALAAALVVAGFGVAGLPAPASANQQACSLRAWEHVDFTGHSWCYGILGAGLGDLRDANDRISSVRNRSGQSFCLNTGKNFSGGHTLRVPPNTSYSRVADHGPFNDNFESIRYC